MFWLTIFALTVMSCCHIDLDKASAHLTLGLNSSCIINFIGQTQLNGLEDNSENMCHELEEQIQDEKDQRQRLEEEKLSLQNEVKLLHSISKGQADTISSLEHGCTKKRPVWSQHYNHNVKTMRIFDELKAVLDTSEVESTHLEFMMTLIHIASWRGS